MKKFFSVLLICLVLPFSLFMVACGDKNQEEAKTWADLATEVPETFNGNQISITTANQLAWIAKEVNSGNDFRGMTVKLEVNLDLKNILWTPIGYGSVSESGEVQGRAFAGTFDGQNNTISNLYVSGNSGAGLFGFVTGSIEYLNIVNAKVYGNDNVGVIAGCAYSNNLANEVSINNCSVNEVELNAKYVNDKKPGSNVGSIVGLSYNVLVVNCKVSNAYVSANSNAGQVVGSVYYADFETGNQIENIEVVWNQTGSGNGKNINQTFAGKVVL